MAQPQVVVHRDFLIVMMCLDSGELGVIDFQDGVIGRVYDLSLLKDCYIVWPRDTQLMVAAGFDDLPDDIINCDFLCQCVQWFDLMDYAPYQSIGDFLASLFSRWQTQYVRIYPPCLLSQALDLYREQEPRLAVFAAWFEAN